MNLNIENSLLQNEINDAFRLNDIKKGFPHTLQCLKLTHSKAFYLIAKIHCNFYKHVQTQTVPVYAHTFATINY